MKNLQNNILRNEWPKVAATTKNVYLCPKIIQEMNKEALLNENEELQPYTMEEINAMIDQAERESAAGLGQDSEDMFRELEEEFVREEQEKHETASV